MAEQPAEIAKVSTQKDGGMTKPTQALQYPIMYRFHRRIISHIAMC